MECDAGEEVLEKAQLSHVEEAAEIQNIVNRVLKGGHDQTGKEYPRFKLIMEKYQENPQLLDPLLQEITAPLAQALQEASLIVPANAPDAAAQHSIVNHLSQMLWVIASVRGPKTVIKLFPHAASDLEPVVHLLTSLETKAEKWETVCVLLLWLSQLVTLPFDLALLDSSLTAAEDASAGKAAYPPLVGRMVELCKRHLASPGSSRDMAAKLLGRLLTRPDTGVALQEYVRWCSGALETDDVAATFLVPGVIRSLCEIMESGQRPKMMPLIPEIWSQTLGLLATKVAAGSVISRKLGMKLVQRMGLVMLPPALSGASEQPAGEDGGGIEVPEEVEEVVEMLLQGLQDGDTVVRWSAAKGIGRIAARLPQELGDEVTGQILELALEVYSPTAWHGACLALAELARRGVLLPYRLQPIAPIIARALQLDIRRGAHSVGAHVRDAAAYVCWAFARAYSADTVLPMVHTLAPALLTAACYDREVNCRRAASAAFQESVGRQGSFPHGIEIITAADYFSLSSRQNAYLVVAPFIAGHREYGPAMRSHLLDVKLRHWEASLRELASLALACLAPTDPKFFATTALDALIPLCTNSSLEVRHGAILGVAELLPALHQQGVRLDATRQTSIACLPQAIVDAKLLRGKGGELTRGATCRLIACLSSTSLPLSSQQQKQCRAILDDSLGHSNQAVQSQAVAAFGSFCSYYVTEGSPFAGLARDYVALLGNEKPPIRRGSAAALGALPPRLLLPYAEEVLLALTKATEIEERKEDRDAESRVAAVKALATVAVHLLSCTTGDAAASSHQQRQEAADLPPRNHRENLEAAAGRADAREAASGPDVARTNELLEGPVVDALMRGLRDYSIDNRGDVGSWVREASMEALVLLTGCLSQRGSTGSRENARLQSIVQGTICGMLQQAVERIARVREKAMTQLQALLALQLPGANIPSRSRLEEVTTMPSMSSISSHEGIHKVAELLEDEAYRETVLLGLVFSVGGVDAALAEAAGDAIARHCSSGEQLQEVSASLLKIWRHNLGCSRLATPFLKTADILLSIDLAGTDNPLAGDLAGDLLEVVQSETRGCRDVARLCAAATVFCRLLQGSEGVQTAALSALTRLLVSGLPRVRKFAAEQLYLHVLMSDSSQSEELSEKLLGTPWDGPLADAKAAQQQVKHLFALA